ncbi:MAG: sensor histidine kinase [Chitinophagales bacterium]
MPRFWLGALVCFCCLDGIGSASDTLLIKNLGDSAWALKTSNIVAAKSLATREVALAEQLTDRRWIAFALNDAGTIEFLMGNFNAAEQLWQRALKLRVELKDEEGRISVLSKLSTLYTKRGDFQKSLETQLQTLRHFEKSNQPDKVAMTLSNIATLYFELRNNEKALEYARLGSAAAAKLSNPQILQNALTTLARAQMTISHNDSARMLYHQALTISSAINDQYTACIIYNNLASTYETDHQIDSALVYFRKALALAEQQQNKSGICRNANALGLNLLQQKRADEAAPYLEKAYQTAVAIGQKTVIQGASASLAEYYRQKGNYNRSNYFLEAYVAIRDTLFKEDLAATTAEMETRYETEKKEQQIKIQQLKLVRRNFIIGAIGLLFVISALISFLLYQRYRRRQEERMQEALRVQREAQTRAVLQAEEEERQRIGIELHDGVGQLLSALKLNLSLQDAAADASNLPLPIHQAMQLADEAVKEVRQISHNLMPSALVQYGLEQAVRTFISKINSHQLRVHLHIEGLETRLNPTTETVLFRVLQELLTNVIRHANATEVTIQLIRFQQEVTLMVEDNGVGFDQNKLEEGLGIRNIRSRVTFLHGQVQFDAHPGKGTTVTVELPAN